MPSSLIREASRRGKAEASRRDLQYQVDDAYWAEVSKVEDAQTRKRERAEAKRKSRANAARAGRILLKTAITFGWLGGCVAVGVDRTWEIVPALDDLFWGNEWLAYLGLLVIFSIGRRVTLELFGFDGGG